MPIVVFVHFSVLKLGVRTWQTDGRTGKIGNVAYQDGHILRLMNECSPEQAFVCWI